MATANNLASILTSKGSHDSFHSTSSNHHSSADAIAPHPEAPDDAALQLHDVETFLNEPSTIDLLATSASSKKRKTAAGSGSSSAEPIQLGSPKTSHNVSLLYIECQQRGIDPVFEFEGDQDGFSSSVTISGKTFSSDQLFATKKEAKENLAGKALPFVKAMECHAKVAAGPQENWIGKLLEYHNASSPTQGPIYTEYALPGNSFACTCQIPSHPTPFGGSDIPFPSKKAARVNAARSAMQHLITQGLTEPDGSLKNKKKAKLGTAVKVDSNGVRKNATFSQKVNDLSNVLGLGTPTYQLVPNPEATAIFSGAAHFTSTPLFTKPVGEVRNVYGRKNAKEECARSALKILIDLAKKRGVNLDEVIGAEGDVTMET